MDTFNCPSCGVALQVAQTGQTRWQQAQGFNLGQASMTTAWTRSTPHRAPTPSGDVIVPAAQAAITGLVGGLAVIPVIYLAGWSWIVSPCVFCLTFCISWLWLLADHRSLLRVVESMQTEPEAQEPPPAEETIRLLPVTGHGVKAMAACDSPVNHMIGLGDGRKIEGAKLRDMVIGGQIVGLTLETWQAKGWTRAEWELSRDILAQAMVATPRIRGQAGQMLKERGDALRLLGV